MKKFLLALTLLLAALVPAQAAPQCIGGMAGQYFIASDTGPSAQVYDPARGFVTNTDTTYKAWLASNAPCPISGTTITGAANNGSGAVRLAVTSTSALLSNQWLQVYATPTYDGTWQITVIDGTHVDLVASTFSGSVSTGAIYGPQIFATAATLYANINGYNKTIPPPTYALVTMSSNTNLSAPLATWIDISSTSNNLIAFLPKTNLAGSPTIGVATVFFNSGNYRISIQDNGGSSTVLSLAPGQSGVLTLNNNTSPNGLWSAPTPTVSTGVNFTSAGIGWIPITRVNGNGVNFWDQLTPSAAGSILVDGGSGAVAAWRAMSGDCANNPTLVVTCAKLNGVAYPAAPSVNTVPIVTNAAGGGTVTYETVPVNAGGTGDTGTAWSTFTPALTCGSGSITSYTAQTGRFKTLGKTGLGANIHIQVNNAGTCSGALTITGFPFLIIGSAAPCMLAGKDYGTNKIIMAGIDSGTTSGTVINFDGTNPAPATANLVVNGTCEAN